jgi:hypothetical protein
MTRTERRPSIGYHAIAYEDDTYLVLAEDTEPARVKVFVKEGGEWLSSEESYHQQWEEVAARLAGRCVALGAASRQPHKDSPGDGP